MLLLPTGNRGDVLTCVTEKMGGDTTNRPDLIIQVGTFLAAWGEGFEGLG